MAIVDQLTQLSQVKNDIKKALIDKGIDMTGVPFTEYSEKIAGIGDFPGYQVKIGEFRQNQARQTVGVLNHYKFLLGVFLCVL